MKRTSLTLSVISNWALLAFSVASGLIVTPIVISLVGVSQYGLWTLVLSFAGYYGLLNLGVEAAVIRFVAYHRARGEDDNVNGVVGTAGTMFIGTGSVVALGTFAAAVPVAHFFNVGPESFAEFVSTFRLMGAVAGLTFVANLLSVIVKSSERFVLHNGVDLVTEAVRLGLILALLHHGIGLKALAIAMLIAVLVRIVGHMGLVRVLQPLVRPRVRHISGQMFAQLLGFGVFIVVTGAGDILRFQVDSAVIGRIIGADAVAVYGIALTLCRYTVRVTNSVAAVFVPRLSRLAGEGNWSIFRTQFMRMSQVMASVSFVVGMIIALLGPRFIGVWVGPDFIAAGPVVVVLMIALTPDFATTTSVFALQAVAKHKFYAYISLAEGVANLGISILLAPTYGILGVAVGTLIPALVTRLIVQPIYCAHTLQIDYFRYLSIVFVRPAAAVSIPIFVYYVFGVGSAANSYLGLVIIGAALLLCGGILMLYISIDREQRQSLFHRLAHKVAGSGREIVGPNSD